MPLARWVSLGRWRGITGGNGAAVERHRMIPHPPTLPRLPASMAKRRNSLPFNIVPLDKSITARRRPERER